MAFVTDSNRPQPLRQPPPTACLTASGAASEAPSLPLSLPRPLPSLFLRSCPLPLPPPLHVPQPNLPIKIAAQGMGLLKPIFQAEALVQAAALGALTGVDKAAVAEEIEQNKRANKVLIYTYGLSPFSAEAIAMLEGSGYEYTQIELGLEWFLLGGKGSETRVALSKELEGGATSLPKIFIGGKCIGGCAELAALVEGGELDAMMRSAGARRRR